MAARWNSSRAPEKPRRRDKPQHLVSGRLPLQGFAELSSACASRRSRSLPDSRAIASYSPLRPFEKAEFYARPQRASIAPAKSPLDAVDGSSTGT